MKLISLNTWGGKLYKPLMEFVESEAKTTDVFCFQELYFSKTPRPDIPWIRANLAFELQSLLSDFLMFERLGDRKSDVSGELPDRDVKIGEAIFVKKPITVIESGGFRTYSENDESAKERIKNISGNFHFVEFEKTGESYFIGNVHGIWIPGPKIDSSGRIEQSNRLNNELKKRSGKEILCGDFNLKPETESVAILGSGMRNLIKEYGIKTTRNRYYPDMEKYGDYIADYAFASPNVQIGDFKVPMNEISDHLPLILEFS